MNSVREGRKVLFSIKVSTLLTIILTIVVTIATCNLVLEKKVEEEKQLSEEVLQEVAIGTNKIAVETMNEQSEIKEHFHESARSIDRKELDALLNPTTKIEDIVISKDMDLTVRTGVSKEDFITLMTNMRADTSGFFEENAGLIYDLCEKYEINEIFFCGLISAESGWNIAGNHRRTHNYISLMGSSGSLIQFSSVEEGLEKAASALHNNYLTPGGRFYCGKTLEAVRTRFCPVNPNWTNLVYGRMQQII